MMERKDWIDFEWNKNQKASLQVKAVKGLAGFFILMFLFTILSRGADTLTIAKVTTASVTSGSIVHSILGVGNITANKELDISTVADICIASVEVAEGEYVEAGDVLFYLDIDDLKEKLMTAQNELLTLEATASDKEANEAIEAEILAKSISEAKADYNETVAEAEERVTKTKEEMEKALSAYEAYQNTEEEEKSDTTVYDMLKKTVEEKQSAYDVAEENLKDLESEVEYRVNAAILEAENQTDESSNQVVLTEAEKKAVRQEVEAYYEERIEEARKVVESAIDALESAKTALSVYEFEQSTYAKASYEEQLEALYDAYLEKKESYETAVKECEQTVKNAKKTLESLTETTELVDTVSALMAENDLDLKQIEVDNLQELYDAGGEIKTLVSGLVTGVFIAEGENTTQGKAICIADESEDYKFTAVIEKNTAKYLAVGDSITLDVGDNETVAGLTIDGIEVTADDDTLYEVTVWIPRDVMKIRSVATLSVEKITKSYDYVVSLRALHSDGENAYIYVVSQSETVLGISTTVDKVQVEILDKNNEVAAVSGNIVWGADIVLSSTKTLRSGDRVRLVGSD